MSKQFFSEYFAYIGETEAPYLYHRWCAISMVAALLGRNVYFPFGHGRIYPNMYVMLEGNPGTRKGTAMRPARNLLKDISYTKLAPDRLSAERFIAEMQHLNIPEDVDGIHFENLTFNKPCEIYVMAGEFQDFIGAANINFIGLLTNLWDNLDEYKHPKLRSQSIYVNAPTVNIIGAVNQQSLAISMPAEAIGQGGTSRWIFVHGEPTGKQYTIPKSGNAESRANLQDTLKGIQELKGEITLTSSGEACLDRIYKEYSHMDDFRFAYYNTRRLDHIIKLSIVCGAMDHTTQLDDRHFLEANTILHATEQLMPKAFGEFGKAKHSDVANQIIEFVRMNLAKTKRPAQVRDIWKQVSSNLNKIDDLMDILRGLEMAEKIQQKEIAGFKGFVPRVKILNGWKADMLLPDYLHDEEKR